MQVVALFGVLKKSLCVSVYEKRGVEVKTSNKQREAKGSSRTWEQIMMHVGAASPIDVE